MTLTTNTVHTGDCLDVLDGVADGTVDLILTDPPYGTVKGIAESDGVSHGMKGKTGWDTAVKPERLFELSNRLLRQNGRLIVFAQEPYTSQLATSAIGNLPFSYRLIWRKDHFANSLLAKNAPLNEYEDILVFTKEYDTEEHHPLRSYFGDVMNYINLSLPEINKRLGHRKAEHSFYIESTQFALCTRETYQALIDEFGINQMSGFKPYDELQQIDERFKERFAPVFNLPGDEKYRSNVLEYAKPRDGHHPTQKPVGLMAELVQTYSNAEDLIIDPFAGSGSTLVAADQANRRYIGIEQKPEYAERARVRIGNEPVDPDVLRPNEHQTGLEAFGQ